MLTRTDLNARVRMLHDLVRTHAECRETHAALSQLESIAECAILLASATTDRDRGAAWHGLKVAVGRVAHDDA